MQRFITIGALAIALAVATAVGAARAWAGEPSVMYRTIVVDGHNVFFREAGPKDAPVVLLLHGFPTSSHMFRALIPQLADRYHVVAPDLPGFGFSDAPERAQFTYSFENLAKVVDRFTQALDLQQYALYVFDYGAPIGFRLALAHPERITAIITQNGNAYEEGLSQQWNPIRTYWREPTDTNRAALRGLLTADATKWQYVQGVDDAARVSPEGYALDAALLARPGNDEIQLDLFLDYASNVALYPAFQEYLRTRRPPLLAVWGKRDPIFLPAGAQAFRRDVPAAEVHLYDTGHFALETHVSEIAAVIQHFLDGISLPKRVAVDTSDLDLSDPSDVSTLYRRIQHAARQVCDPEHLDLYRHLVRGYGECYRQTVADAVARAKDRHLRGRPRSTVADEPAGP